MKRTIVTLCVICAVLVCVFTTASAAVETVAPEVVTGSRIYTSLDELPAPTCVITAEDIEQSSAEDLATVLEQNVPGVFVKQKSGVGQDAQITMRGVVTQVLVLVDGVPLYRSSHGSDAATVDYRAFPLENIERVEVVKGGGSAVYGSMAAGGVINIITKTPHKTEAITLAETGPNGWRRYYVSGSSAVENMAARVWYEHIDEGRKRLLYDTTPDQQYNSLDYDEEAYGVSVTGDRWVLRAAKGEYQYKYNTPAWGGGLDFNNEKKKYSRYSFRYDWDNLYLLTGYDTQRYDILQNINNYYVDSAFTTEVGGKSVFGDFIVAWGVFYRYEDTDFCGGGASPVVS
ncbi:MAG: TonB-dependent receptor plug domain-containing protein, partial [Synergistota bacterium]|nr:TonB-dependent receptor plug domain-containing protein [Synergistota bacterium]